MAKQSKAQNKDEGNAVTVAGNTATTDTQPQQNAFLQFRTQALLLAIVSVLFYANTFWHEAAFDDRMAITDNAYVQAGVAGIGDIMTHDAYQSYLEQRQGSNQLAGGRYRPLSLITFAVEQQIMGVPDKETANEKEARVAKEMHSRHVVNVLLYILAVISLLYLFRTIIFPEQPVMAFAAALLFTIHPLHTEVVANVKSRDEILSVLFISLTFIKAFAYYDRRKVKDLVLALGCFFLALLSKEYALTMVVLLPVAFFVFRNGGLKANLMKTMPYLLPLSLYLLLRFQAVTGAAEEGLTNVMNNPYLLATSTQKTASILQVLLHYLQLLFWPVTLSADYSYNQLPYSDFGNVLVWMSILVHVGLAVLMAQQILKKQVLGFALAFYFANLLLVSNLFVNIGAPMGERLVFHSSVGFAIAIASLLVTAVNKLPKAGMRQALTGGTLLVLAVVCGFKTADRNKDWKNDETLFLHDVTIVPNSVLVNNNAAAACMSEAKKNKENAPVRDEWFTKAIHYFDKAIAVYPKHMMAYLNRGVCYYNMGYPERALPDWDTVKKYEPKKPELEKYRTAAASYYYNQGVKYSKNNQQDSAIYAFKKSADISPERAEPWYYLAAAYYVTGHVREARDAIEQSLRIAPGYPDARQLYTKMIEQPDGRK